MGLKDFMRTIKKAIIDDGEDKDTTLPNGVSWALPNSAKGYGARSVKIDNELLRRYGAPPSLITNSEEKDSILEIEDIEDYLKPFGSKKKNYWSKR